MMILYLIKSTVCLLLLLLIYHAFLEKEKMHRFNRYFLIFSLVFSFLIPLLTIHVSTSPVSELQLLNYVDQINERLAGYKTLEIPQTVGKQVTANETDSSFYPPVLFGLYLLIALILAIRLFYNLLTLFRKVHDNPKEKFRNTTLILVENCRTPHSFLKFIFVDKKRYESNSIDKKVLLHEQAHLQQKHSFDILFIELLKVVFWFNPVLYFYKKSMKLNHEFLADEAVITTSKNVKSYQKLLLKLQSPNKKVPLASSIHYSKTKKRIIMMTKKTSRFKSACKQLALIPVLAVLVLAFSAKSINAQNVEQMSIDELMNAIYGKIEVIDSLSAEKRNELQNLLSKIQDELSSKPPKQIMPRKAMLKVYSYKYKSFVNNYLSSNPLKKSRGELQLTYAYLKELHNQIEILKSMVHLKNPPSLPPLPPSPDERIKSYKSAPKQPVEVDNSN